MNHDSPHSAASSSGSRTVMVPAHFEKILLALQVRSIDNVRSHIQARRKNRVNSSGMMVTYKTFERKYIEKNLIIMNDYCVELQYQIKVLFL